MSCYILWEREFIDKKEHIYKVGMTEKGMKRFLNYPKQSLLLSFKNIKDFSGAETMIKKIFAKKFIQRLDIGLEYFEGDIEEMKFLFEKIINFYDLLTMVNMSYTDILKIAEYKKIAKFEKISDKIKTLKLESSTLIEKNKKLIKQNEKIDTKNNKMEKTKEEMSCNILQWFKDNYEHTGNREDLCKMKDLYDDFSGKIYFLSLTKNEKRKYNKSYFVDFVTSNPFFGKYYKNKIGKTNCCLVGWKKIDEEHMDDDEDEEHMDDEDEEYNEQDEDVKCMF